MTVASEPFSGFSPRITNDMSDVRDLEQTILATVAAVFRNKGLDPPKLSMETPFDRSLGIESLDFAEVIVRLEDELGQDPFATATEWQVRTIGDLVAMYRA